MIPHSTALILGFNMIVCVCMYVCMYVCSFRTNEGFVAYCIHCRVMDGFTDSVVVERARYAWKYAASRGITGTPQFIVNGVNVPQAQGYDADQWGHFINDLLTTPF